VAPVRNGSPRPAPMAGGSGRNWEASIPAGILRSWCDDAWPKRAVEMPKKLQRRAAHSRPDCAKPSRTKRRYAANITNRLHAQVRRNRWGPAWSAFFRAASREQPRPGEAQVEKTAKYVIGFANLKRNPQTFSFSIGTSSHRHMFFERRYPNVGGGGGFESCRFFARRECPVFWPSYGNGLLHGGPVTAKQQLGNLLNPLAVLGPLEKTFCCGP